MMDCRPHQRLSQCQLERGRRRYCVKQTATAHGSVGLERMQRAIGLCLVAVLLGCSEEQKTAVPIKQVIAQCELKARDRYNFRIDVEYSDGMDYLKVCMLSLGYELDTNIGECQSILQRLTYQYREKLEQAKTDEEKKNAQEELYRQMSEAVINFIPTHPECYRRL
jgi:hypothetical protein